MRITSRSVALSLCMSMMVALCPNVSAQTEAEINIRVQEAASGGSKSPDCAEVNPTFEQQRQGQLPASEVVELFYLRSASALAQILGAIVEVNPCLEGIVITRQGNTNIVLYGQQVQRDFLKRVIAMLDLRREGVEMAMWGILISSENPGELAQAMREINIEISRTRDLLLKTYLELDQIARRAEIDPNLKNVFAQLGYPNALDSERPYLSMTDILLRINAAENYQELAKDICRIFEFNKELERNPYSYYVQELQRSGGRPFGNYLERAIPGLYDNNTAQCEDDRYTRDQNRLETRLRRRKALLNFALNYAHFSRKPDEFDPEALQRSAETVNVFLNPIVDAINRDVEELFMRPTLQKIQNIVGHFGDVSYAEVGRTRVVGLNGVKSSVRSTTVSSFDETGPLRLNELLREAGEINQFSRDLFPSFTPSSVPGATSVEDLGVPASSIVSLFAALTADRSIFRALTSGVSLDITPSVLRNSASAELKISLTTAPQATETTTENANLRPLSRISQNTVDTKVYVNALDIFPISTFNNQTTIDGGRSYIPVIGTIWQGIFSGIPIFGDLFSWRNHPRSVQHQSIVLTNSFILPTAMGLAPLYDNIAGGKADLFSACIAVDSYFSEQRRRLDELKEEQERTFLNPDSSEEQVFGQPPSSGFPPPSFGSSTSFGYSRECERFRTNPL